MLSVREQFESVLYPEYIHPLSQPAHLAAVARILGHRAPDPTRARVLDLGCARGANLLALAARFPESRCLGLDFSQPQISDGQGLIEAAGLTNAALRTQDLTTWDPAGAEFDYILAYGVFSWVEDPVKERVLALCRQCLAPTGIACISYLTYPGCKQSEALRDLVRLRCDALDTFQEKVVAAHGILDFLAQAYESARSSPHAASWLDHVRQMRAKDPVFLFHDDLGRERDPCYLLQFVDRASSHGLQYLGDSTFGTMLIENLAGDAGKRLAGMGLSRIEAEQFLDFAICRTFRVSLLVRQEAILPPELDADGVRELCLGTSLRPDAKGAGEPAEAVFRTPLGSPITVRGLPLVAFLRGLTERGRGVFPFQEALARAQMAAGRSFDDRELTRLCADLVVLFGRGQLEFSAAPIRVLAAMPERPQLSRFNRALAEHRGLAVSPAHEPLSLNASDQALCAMLDGTRTLTEIQSWMGSQPGAGALQATLGRLFQAGCLESGREPNWVAPG
jgi:SAM-dependent methyltransferase